MTPWFFAIAFAAFPLGVIAGVHAEAELEDKFTGPLYISSIVLVGVSVGIIITKTLS